tara:strand:- start:952 stop:1476 length:525 start_codon:yes stop_codon:yes gene_type:complete
MDKVLSQQEDIDLSGDNILSIVDNKANLLSYHQLYNLNNLNEVLGQYGCAIILYETKLNFGHWVCVFNVNPNTIEFFDSYGFAPDAELNYAHFDKEPILSRFLKESGKTIIHNTIRLQQFAKDINTCGRWTSVRVKMRQIPLKTFQSIFTNNAHYDGDVWVSALTYLETFSLSK